MLRDGISTTTTTTGDVSQTHGDERQTHGPLKLSIYWWVTWET
jgi:hypothetical protein